KRWANHTVIGNDNTHATAEEYTRKRVFPVESTILATGVLCMDRNTVSSHNDNQRDKCWYPSPIYNSKISSAFKISTKTTNARKIEMYFVDSNTIRSILCWSPCA